MNMDETEKDALDSLEKEFVGEPRVFGTPDQIMDTYNALMWAAGTFGRRVKEEMTRAIMENHPRLAEIEAEDSLEAVLERYFGTDEVFTETVDIVAEAIVTAQKWLALYMKAHSIEELNLLIPSAFSPQIRAWKFGVASLSALDESGFHVAATLPVEE